jgi:hypothetical protein
MIWRLISVGNGKGKRLMTKAICELCVHFVERKDKYVVCHGGVLLSPFLLASDSRRRYCELYKPKEDRPQFRFRIPDIEK